MLEGKHRTIAITCDARSIRNTLTACIGEGAKLPAWVLPLAQHLYPDLCLIDAKPTAGPSGQRVAVSRRRRSWIRILELKYAPDLELSGRVRDEAIAQHAALRNSLLRAGWGEVTIHPVIIGNAGTITADALVAFEHLGVSPASGIKLAKYLALASIRHTAKIKRARLSHGAGPQKI